MIALPMIMFMISLKAASMTYITVFLPTRKSGISGQKQQTGVKALIGSFAIPECTDKYLWLAGINGSWVQAFDFARDHGQYSSPWVIGPGPYFRRTAGAFVNGLTIRKTAKMIL
jgi:hypothetical protein